MSLYLRLSVTDRCNFFCRYCRPPTPEQQNRQPHLTDDEILTLVDHIHRVGSLRKIRLTGGDPLMRPRLPGLVSALRRLLPDAELCLTTNGARLSAAAAPLRKAGLDRVNVSLDSLSPARFAAITGVDRLDQVLQGIRAAGEAGFTNLKINAVLQRSSTGKELSSMVRFAASHSAELRFIELMPMGVARRIYDQEFLPAAEALAILQTAYHYLGPAPGSDTSQRHRFRMDDREITVGLITPISDPFCTQCDRIRLDSRGRLLSCLRRQAGADLVTLLRADRMAALDKTISTLLCSKDLPESHWPNRQMALIGG
jgi:cyclic pyranopterin phosphate synthase